MTLLMPFVIMGMYQAVTGGTYSIRFSGTGSYQGAPMKALLDFLLGCMMLGCYGWWLVDMLRTYREHRAQKAKERQDSP